MAPCPNMPVMFSASIMPETGKKIHKINYL